MTVARHEFIDGTRFADLGDICFSDQHMNPRSISEQLLNQQLERHVDTDRLPIIYVSSDHVTQLFAACENVKHEFVLLSHNGDTTFTGHVERMPACVRHWFGQNINTQHARVTPIPIGLEREFWSQSRYGKHGHIHDRLSHWCELSTKLARVIKCYINFSPGTNGTKRGWIAEHFKNDDWCMIHMPGINGDLETYFEHLKRAQFVLCPDGNGVDCHRNWNTLYMGAVPVLERCSFHEQVYRDLPVLFVDSFKQLTLTMLQEHRHLINTGDHAKLRMSWWTDKIMKACQQ